eukprot:CAMPEP_0114373648 /NCGR_PEP_ID=MMETSP0101-20121206/35013_1 /TAXON_ID=38822 ORGANISM="Pteridomonas danica, Strain PT" /NCGR_SAMPLE_ID=MMETSP0101 /ASSEMBLY_ACC=CAM_ASM_000211 /LENGTH=87 /DNA_ID=CAMNT_0001526973 /DNA_START=31 /DNA_END=294 /DNA_ORIENTATION=+
MAMFDDIFWFLCVFVMIIEVVAITKESQTFHHSMAMFDDIFWFLCVFVMIIEVVAITKESQTFHHSMAMFAFSHIVQVWSTDFVDVD